jgi:hypothetical protein
MWISLSVVAAIFLLVSFFRGPNAVWGGASTGVFGGVVAALLASAAFSWTTVGKGLVVGVLAGSVAELLGWISRHGQRGEPL